MKTFDTDILIVGSGLAALAYIHHLSPNDSEHVMVVSKTKVRNSNSWHAQGGVAAALDSNDTTELHYNDTMKAGHFMNDSDVVRMITMRAPETISELIDMGVPFDRNDKGELDLRKEGGHSHSRIIHAGDHTGKTLVDFFINRISKERIELMEDTMVFDLLAHENRCYGVRALQADGVEVAIRAKITILATGGCGQLFINTSNPIEATGDGLALAQQHQIAMRDLHMIQFHPTALVSAEDQSFLISEAVRGMGAELINSKGEAFMYDYHEDGPLATRDVVTAAILDQFRQLDDDRVYLKVPLSEERMAEAFPTIYGECIARNIDPCFIPVAPAAHYLCGGIQVPLNGQTSMRGLLAIGELAGTGLHGTNRLASNSLLELLIMAKDAAAHTRVQLPLLNDVNTDPISSTLLPSDHQVDHYKTKRELQILITNAFGPESNPTNKDELAEYLTKIHDMAFATADISEVQYVLMCRAASAILEYSNNTISVN